VLNKLSPDTNVTEPEPDLIDEPLLINTRPLETTESAVDAVPNSADEEPNADNKPLPDPEAVLDERPADKYTDPP